MNPTRTSRPLVSSLLALVVLALSACSSPGPSIKKIRADIQEIITKRTFGVQFLSVTSVQIDSTDQPAEDRLNYRVTVTLEVPPDKMDAADNAAHIKLGGTTLDPFFRLIGRTPKDVKQFLNGDRKTTVPLLLYYRMESKDIWTLKDMRADLGTQ
ncbi:MAG TPA: hypothetical protein ENI94_06720 [Gammaproteobacteria bacterium]|nr:hypothetical protein [Gammaproteobacteria bacterium]